MSGERDWGMLEGEDGPSKLPIATRQPCTADWHQFQGSIRFQRCTSCDDYYWKTMTRVTERRTLKIYMMSRVSENDLTEKIVRLLHTHWMSLTTSGKSRRVWSVWKACVESVWKDFCWAQQYFEPKVFLMTKSCHRLVLLSDIPY